MTTRKRASRRGVLKAGLGGAVGLVLGGSALHAIADDEDDEPKKGYAPDPPPRAAKKQWIFDVEVEKGKVRIDKIRTVTLDKARTTPRVMGRFAIELYIGTELLDRVRFNVPLAGDGPRENKSPFARPGFEQVNVSLMVRMADNPRATYGQLVDRATEEVTPFTWPPEAESGDAGVGSADGGAIKPVKKKKKAKPKKKAAPPLSDAGS